MKNHIHVGPKTVLFFYESDSERNVYQTLALRVGILASRVKCQIYPRYLVYLPGWKSDFKFTENWMRFFYVEFLSK